MGIIYGGHYGGLAFCSLTNSLIFFFLCAQEGPLLGVMVKAQAAQCENVGLSPKSSHFVQG